MKEEIKLFNNYVKQFDLKNKHIMGKFHHSYRVMEFAIDIAKSLELSEKDIYIASLAGLLHDIGRFNQMKNYNTYSDEKSIDHGDEGYRVLKEIINEFTKDEEIKNIVLSSTKYHNKYKIEELDERTMLFCKIVRDADKLDIMKEQCNSITEKEIILKSELLTDVYSKKMCKNEYCENEVDYIIRMLDWVFDLNFKYSFNYLIQNKVIDNKFNLLEMYGETNEIKKLKDFIYNEIEKRC